MSDPRTIIELIDQSAFLPAQLPDDNSPVFMAAFTADKGPEELMLVGTDTFNKYYGSVPKTAFARHGQPYIQAAKIVQNGGRVLAKRVVATDSALANVIFALEIKKVAEEGTTGVKLTMKTVKEASSASAIKVYMQSLLNTTGDGGDNNDSYVYPLFAVTENGRGVSNKRIRISTDYTASKKSDYVVYLIEVMENNRTVEKFNFTLTPGIINGGVNYNIDSIAGLRSTQIKACYSEDLIELMFEQYAEAASSEDFPVVADDVKAAVDILFGKTKTGEGRADNNILRNITMDVASANPSSIFGIELQSGNNGKFGVAPIANIEEKLDEAFVAFFSGQDTEEIYDLVNYQVTGIIDANYATPVKAAIEGLVEFREDLFFFRDLGIGANSIDGIKALQSARSVSKFCATYHMSYDVIEPDSMKQVTVTSGYSLAKLVTQHCLNGCSRPLNGQLYGFIIDDAIKGTINYIPRVTPSVNQREQLSDLHVNYASYYGDLLVVETQNTSQNTLSQFSYVSNILAIQELMRAIRQRCPVIRGMFLDGQDLQDYQADVQKVINRFAKNFLEITFEYIEDETMILNKIFYAAIKVKFRNYVESEYFKIYAII